MIHFRIYRDRIAVALCKARKATAERATTSPDVKKVDCPACQGALAQQRSA